VPDSTLARALRLGVRRDGRALLPFMEYQNLSEEDLVALISYLRTQPAVNHLVPAHQLSPLGRVVLATVLSQPVGPKAPPAVTSPTGATVENGRYLVEELANCVGCHTVRDERNGELVGPRFGGAKGAFEDEKNSKRMWSPPNITSAPKTGRLAQLTEDGFVARFRTGEMLAGSPMPWEHFKRMHEEDLRAIYRYLMTVPPVENDPGPSFYDKP